MGKQPQRADRQLHPLQSDVLHNRQPAAVGGYERDLAVDARVLEDGLRRRARRRTRSDLLSILVRAVSRLLDRVRGGVPDRRALYPRRRHVEPGAPVDDRNAATHGHLLHSHLCAPFARGCGRNTGPGGGSLRQLRMRSAVLPRTAACPSSSRVPGRSVRDSVRRSLPARPSLRAAGAGLPPVWAAPKKRSRREAPIMLVVVIGWRQRLNKLNPKK